MSIPIDKKAIYSARYPHGTIIELTTPIIDPYGGSKPKGSRFKVDFVDDALNLHGSWLPPQKGSLSIIIEHDSFKVVES